MSESRTDISELGEFGIIDQLTKGVELKNPTSILGVGDDAAVIDAGNDEFILVSTDALVEGIHDSSI
jgi:thiamine-monophosphate kinase